MLNRAYSLLEVKGIDEEKREITGMATTPTPDRYGDIVEPKGAAFDLPIPLLWQHDGNQPVGKVLAAKVTKDGIEVRAQFAKVDGPQPMKDRLDEAWQSVKTGLVRGLSIGFRSIDHEPIDKTGGLRFLKWAWLELSAVTIPANAEASISTIKAIDSKARAATGRKRATGVRLISSPGVTGKTKSVKLIRSKN